MKNLMVLMSLILLSVSSVAQDTAADIDLEIAKLQKALIDAPTVKIEEQTNDVALRNAAILAMQKAAPIVAEYKQLQTDIDTREAKIKSIMSVMGANDKNKYGETKGQKQAQPIQDELNKLKQKKQELNYKYENVKSEYQSLKTRYNDSLNAKIAELKYRKQNLNNSAIASIPAKAPEPPAASK